MRRNYYLLCMLNFCPLIPDVWCLSIGRFPYPSIWTSRAQISFLCYVLCVVQIYCSNFNFKSFHQARQQHNLEREERCLAGDAPAAVAGGARGRGSKAQNAAQQARIKHNQGVKASSNVSPADWAVCLLRLGLHGV